MFDLRRRLYGPSTLILPAGVLETRQLRLAEDDFRAAGIVFIHVPKTAGLSVVQAVYHCNALRHFTLEQFLRRAPDDLLRLPRFAIVRNPWDRAVSSYHFARQGGVENGAQMLHPRRYRGKAFTTFDTFVKEYLAVRDVRKLDGVFRPQTYYLGFPEKLDHLGRFEHLAATEEWLSETLGRLIAIPQSNSTPHESYRSYYTDTTREIVGEVYRSDIERFGFEF